MNFIDKKIETVCSEIEKYVSDNAVEIPNIL